MLSLMCVAKTIEFHAVPLVNVPGWNELKQIYFRYNFQMKLQTEMIKIAVDTNTI